VLRINGSTYKTVADAAAVFGVSVKTVRGYINNGIIPRPPQKSYGLREIDVFPDEYMQTAANSIKEHKRKKRQSLKG
jgi:hypothetical protein